MTGTTLVNANFEGIEGGNKVHVAVQFSRWRRDGSLIGRYKSIDIVTNQDGRWGIQARSSFAA